MKIILVLDDCVRKGDVIKEIIGDRGFLDVVVKRKKLKDYYIENVKSFLDITGVYCLNSYFEMAELSSNLESNYSKDTRVIHAFADYIISDNNKLRLSYEKIKYVDETYKAMDGKHCAGLLFPSIDEYMKYLHEVLTDNSQKEGIKNISAAFPIEGLSYIGETNNFIQCITGNFDARYFNSLKGDEYTIIKTSTNKEKIKAEYSFYHLLPEDMRFFFVEPFNYTEDNDKASYTMERLHMTDLAIKWVHGSIDEEELNLILDKYFYFFNSRHEKEVSAAEYRAISDELYENKVSRRIEELKKLKEYENIERLLLINGLTIDKIFEEYKELKEKIESKVDRKNISVIGHGDPCFANTMYNKSTRTLKFIDPKGALTKEELYTNPYYDIAKLSHSICGRYDFFNNALFEIVLSESFDMQLTIDFDNSNYIQVFKNKLEENGYDYNLVRLYEASLFLSMLPLHMDNPRKVYGFILNAYNIIKEIGKNV